MHSPESARMHGASGTFVWSSTVLTVSRLPQILQIPHNSPSEEFHAFVVVISGEIGQKSGEYAGIQSKKGTRASNAHEPQEPWPRRSESTEETSLESGSARHLSESPWRPPRRSPTPNCKIRQKSRGDRETVAALQLTRGACQIF